MSLISGPGRGGASGPEIPNELLLYVDKHVQYIQGLDTVRPLIYVEPRHRSSTDSGKMSSNTG